MKNIRLYAVLISLVTVIFPLALKAQWVEEIKEVKAASLENNILNENTLRKLKVYLPESYQSSGKSYPVVYYLMGWGGATEHFNGQELLASYSQSMPSQEFIFVVVDGKNQFSGSFYVNSPVTGNWEDYVVKDVIGFIDQQYPTLKKKESRAISGHSMGGFGCLSIAMKYPDLFSVVYSLSPGLYDPSGLENNQMFNNEEAIRNYLAFYEAHKEGPDIDDWVENAKSPDWVTTFALSYGTSFVPDSKSKAPYFQYPYSAKGEKLEKDPQLFQEWHDKGFARIVNQLNANKVNWDQYKLIALDCGYNDYFPWIVDGTLHLSKMFGEKKISHQLIMHQGDHMNKLYLQLEDSALPLMLANLEFN